VQLPIGFYVVRDGLQRAIAHLKRQIGAPPAPRSQALEKYRSWLADRTIADWVAQAEQFERMAERFKGTPELSDNFKKLAAYARDRTRHRRS